MTKINYMKLIELNKHLSNFVIHAITQHTIKETGQAMFTHVKGWENLNQDGGMEIKYSIDGIELDFIECWKDYEEAWEKDVRKQAKEIITDKMWKTFDGIRDNARILENYMKKKVDELFPDLVDDDRY